jgi:hypothetical protein
MLTERVLRDVSLRCRYAIINEHTVLVDPTTGRIVQVVDKMQGLGRFLCVRNSPLHSALSQKP